MTIRSIDGESYCHQFRATGPYSGPTWQGDAVQYFHQLHGKVRANGVPGLPIGEHTLPFEIVLSRGGWSRAVRFDRVISIVPVDQFPMTRIESTTINASMKAKLSLSFGHPDDPTEKLIGRFPSQPIVFNPSLLRIYAWYGRDDRRSLFRVIVDPSQSSRAILELLDGDTCVFRGTMENVRYPFEVMSNLSIPTELTLKLALDLDPRDPDRRRQTLARLAVRVTGDPIAAAENLEAQSYWSGSFTGPFLEFLNKP